MEGLTGAQPPGRVLDLGCGTGANDAYLASQGWEVVGVDFAPEAVEEARNRAQRAGVAASFVVGDVSRLRELGVRGPFDLLLDFGCFHAIPADRRDAFAAEVAAVARPGAHFYVAGITEPPVTWRLLGASGLNGEDLRKRFSDQFEVTEEQPTGRGFVVHHLVRRGDGAGGA
jgi:SAM-dependent methyltransferase